MGISGKAYMLIEQPVMRNVLAIGDAPSFAEVEKPACSNVWLSRRPRHAQGAYR